MTTTTTNYIQPLTPEWHEARKRRITGTDVAAIMGASPHKTALQVWARLTGKLESDFQGNGFTRWGNATEDANRALLADEAGLEVSDSPGFVIDAECDWLGATPDGLIAQQGSDDFGVWEGKSPSMWTADDWTEDEAPLAYQIQQQAQMRVTGLGWGVLSALIPPRKADDSPLWWRQVEANVKFQETMMGALIDFWDKHVMLDIPPDATGRPVDAQVLRELHPRDNGSAIRLDPSMDAVIFQLEKAKAEEKRQSKIRKDLEATLRQRIGDATFATSADGERCWSWKTQTQQIKAHDAYTREVRVLRSIKRLPKGVEVSE